MSQQQMHKIEAQAANEAMKSIEKQNAIDLEKMPPVEQMKRKEDQHKRMQKVEKNLDIYRKKVVPQNEAKVKKTNDLLNMYVE